MKKVEEQVSTQVKELKEKDSKFNSLHELSEKGELSSPTLVEVAKEEDHPYHKDVWGKSDEELAYKQRLQIAQRIIHAYRYVLKVTILQGEDEKHITTYPTIRTGNNDYKTLDVAIKDADDRSFVIRRALLALNSAVDKCRLFEELNDLVEKIDATELEELSKEYNV